MISRAMARALFCLTTPIGLYSRPFRPTAGNTPPAAVAVRLGKWFVGRDSSVGIATRYGLDGPGIESRWGRDLGACPDRLEDPPSLLYNGYRVIPGRLSNRGVALTTHPQLAPRLQKE
jgi:hypothetical protein